MTEVELAWAAGLFEGEGCFTFSKMKNRKNSIKVSAVIGMTDKDVLDRFASIMGFGNIKGPYKSSYPTCKPRYTWEVQSQPDVLRTIDLLLPFLMSRRRDKALEIKQEIENRLYAKLGFPKGFDGNIYSQISLTSN